MALLVSLKCFFMRPAVIATTDSRWRPRGKALFFPSSESWPKKSGSKWLHKSPDPFDAKWLWIRCALRSRPHATRVLCCCTCRHSDMHQSVRAAYLYERSDDNDQGSRPWLSLCCGAPPLLLLAAGWWPLSMLCAKEEAVMEVQLCAQPPWVSSCLSSRSVSQLSLRYSAAWCHLQSPCLRLI